MDPSLRAERRLAERRRTRRHRALALATLALAALALGVAVGAGRDRGADEAAPGAGERAARAEGSGGQRATEGAALPQVATVRGFKGPVAILMYHAIAEPPAGTPYPDLFVPASELRVQLRALARAGYNAVTLSAVLDAWEQGEPIARNPVVLSFDDGLRSQYTEALPALARHGWPGVLNLKVASLDQGEITEEMVAEMVAGGWEVGAHTITHADLTTVDAAQLRREVSGSRRALERRLGTSVDVFCYPGGRYDEAVVAAVRDAGFRAATTTEPGLARRDQDRFALSRIRVDRGDGAAGLMRKLELAGMPG